MTTREVLSNVNQLCACFFPDQAPPPGAEWAHAPWCELGARDTEPAPPLDECSEHPAVCDCNAHDNMRNAEADNEPVDWCNGCGGGVYRRPDGQLIRVNHEPGCDRASDE